MVSWRGPKSIARRLTYWYSASLVLILVGSSAFLYQSLTQSLDNENRNLLDDRVQAIVSLLERDPTLGLLKRRVETEWAYHRLEKVYVQVTDNLGRVVSETPGVPDWARQAAFGPAIESARDILRLKTPAHPSLLLLTARVGNPAGWKVRVALDQENEERLLASYQWRIAFTLLVALALSFGLGKWIAFMGLRPVEAMADSMGQIRSTDLSRRISVDLPSELEVLGSTFNELLDKIEASMKTLSQFSADIAHELRNPIHNIRGEMEVALGRCREPAQYQEVLSSCLEECDRLKSIVDSLLFLARMESNNALLERAEFDLQPELGNLVDFYEASASDATVLLRAIAPEGLRMNANRALVLSAVGNLLSNAIRHTPPGGTVTLTAQGINGDVVLEVADSGSGIAKENLPLVFDRFFRVDEQRSSQGEHHFGLGLSIVQAILKVHQGRVEIESVVGKGTKVRLLFPSLKNA